MGPQRAAAGMAWRDRERQTVLLRVRPRGGAGEEQACDERLRAARLACRMVQAARAHRHGGQHRQPPAHVCVPPHLDQRPLPAIQQRVLKLDVAARHALHVACMNRRRHAILNPDDCDRVVRTRGKARRAAASAAGTPCTAHAGLRTPALLTWRPAPCGGSSQPRPSAAGKTSGPRPRAGPAASTHIETGRRLRAGWVWLGSTT